jgi:hypothetical protein
MLGRGETDFPVFGLWILLSVVTVLPSGCSIPVMPKFRAESNPVMPAYGEPPGYRRTPSYG